VTIIPRDPVGRYISLSIRLAYNQGDWTLSEKPNGMPGNLSKGLTKKMPRGNTLSWSMKLVVQLDKVLMIQLLGHDGSQEAKNLLAELLGESVTFHMGRC
jgi:hypothetical protein